MLSRNNVPSVLMHHNETRGSNVRILDGNNSATWLIVRHVDDYCSSLAALSPSYLLRQLLRNLQLKINGRDRTWANHLYWYMAKGLARWISNESHWRVVMQNSWQLARRDDSLLRWFWKIMLFDYTILFIYSILWICNYFVQYILRMRRSR